MKNESNDNISFGTVMGILWLFAITFCLLSIFLSIKSRVCTYYLNFNTYVIMALSSVSAFSAAAIAVLYDMDKLSDIIYDIDMKELPQICCSKVFINDFINKHRIFTVTWVFVVIYIILSINLIIGVTHLIFGLLFIDNPINIVFAIGSICISIMTLKYSVGFNRKFNKFKEFLGDLMKERYNFLFKPEGE